MKKLLLGLSAFAGIGAGVVSVSSCGGEYKVNSHKNFIVGMDVDYPPYDFLITDAQYKAMTAEQKEMYKDFITDLDGDGYAAGFDIYVAKLIAAKFGKELEIKKTEFDALIPTMMNRHEIDAIIAGMTPTEERLEKISFSKPYLLTHLGMLIPHSQAGTINAQTDITTLKGEVDAQTGTTHSILASQLAAKAPGLKAVDIEEASGVVQSVKKGHYGITENPVGLVVAAENADIDFIQTYPLSTEGIDNEEAASAIGVEKGFPKEDMVKMNEVMDSLGGSKEMDALLKKASDLYALTVNIQ